MMAVPYATHYNKRQTPQSEPIPGERQVRNNAGGYVYAVDKWARLTRFLILGADGGTFYVRERALSRDNAQVVEACLVEDGRRTVDVIVAVSDAGRAPKNDAAIFALALAAAATDVRTRSYALAALPKICRIPTHLFHFVAYCKGLRGWGRGLRRAIEQWYGRWTPDQLAYEIVKYQNRDGWSHRDVLRVAHPRLIPEAQAALRWAIGASTDARSVARGPKNRSSTRTYPATGALPAIVQAFESAKTSSVSELVVLIRNHNLSREMVPTAALNDREVWNALLQKMPLTAMIRNLAKMTAVGLIAPLAEATRLITTKLADADALRKARIHPLAILNALRVYSAGHGDKGSLTWTPVGAVVDALDAAFYLSFGNVTPTNKRLMLALDVSGSMSASIAGTRLSCREASAALALVTANVEPHYLIAGFTNTGGRRSRWAGYASGISELAISPRQRLDDVVRYLSGMDFGGTDCALPMLHATERKLDVDAFCVYTDSETWAGSVHPSQALREYRRVRNRSQAACVVVGMTATEFTIADPTDPQMLDVVGFDLATPEAISAFLVG